MICLMIASFQPGFAQEKSDEIYSQAKVAFNTISILTIKIVIANTAVGCILSLL